MLTHRSLSVVPILLVACFCGVTPVFAAAQSPDSAPPTADAAGLEEFVAPPEPSMDEVMSRAREQAFKNSVEGAMPLTPDQISEIIRRMSEVQEVAAPALANPERPKGITKVETISLDPGATPPVIKVAAGYVTSVMVMDATGAPWEIKDLAYVGKFNATVPEDSPYVFRILPLNRFYEGNLTLQLVGLATPVTFRLVANEDEVYYRYDVRVPAIGPNAKPPRFAAANTLVAGDAVMMSVLSGYPPASAKRLAVSGLDDRTAAWEVGGQIYLRTPLDLLSPAWSSSTSSGDGTKVYAIPDTPVLLLSDQGVMLRARISRPQGLVGSEGQ